MHMETVYYISLPMNFVILPIDVESIAKRSVFVIEGSQITLPPHPL